MKKKMSMKREIWKDIPGYEGLYRASDLGRIKSLGRLVKNSRGSYFKLGRILRQCPTRVYLSVSLHKNRKQKNFVVHTLVLLAFVGYSPKGTVARHFPNRDPFNNKLTNLSWSTQLINQRDRFIHGTDSQGEKNGSSKLTKEDVVFIRNKSKDNVMIGTDFRVRDGIKRPYGRNVRIAKLLFEEHNVKITPTMIGYIINKKNWKCLL